MRTAFPGIVRGRPCRSVLVRVLPLLLGLLVAGCLYRPPPATVPLRTLEISPGSPEARCLVIFLPGRGDTPEHFVRNGFPEDLRRAGSRCALRGVDVHLGYFFERTITERLREDVIAPAQAEGYEEIWLVGISLGGFGSLLYTKDHPGDIAGIVAIAPYLGERELTDEIAAAGGVESWVPRETPRRKDLLAFWAWLKGYRHPDADHPPLFLAFGAGDRFAQANELVGDLLPADHIFRVRGGHTWATWRRAWDAFLASGSVPGRVSGRELQEPVHHEGIDQPERPVPEGLGQGADDPEAHLLPEGDGALVGAHHEVELQGEESGPARLLQRVLAHRPPHAPPRLPGRDHVAHVGHMGAEARLVGPQ